MIRFYAMRVWKVLHDMGYDYVMRLDDDSMILSEIPYNIFDFMAEHRYDYGYRVLTKESGYTGEDWWDFHRPYLQTIQTEFNRTAEWLYKPCQPAGEMFCIRVFESLLW